MSEVQEIAGRDETDWHVLAQDVANHWQHPEERAVAYQAAAEAIKAVRAHLQATQAERK